MVEIDTTSHWSQVMLSHLGPFGASCRCPGLLRIGTCRTKMGINCYESWQGLTVLHVTCVVSTGRHAALRDLTLQTLTRSVFNQVWVNRQRVDMCADSGFCIRVPFFHMVGDRLTRISGSLEILFVYLSKLRSFLDKVYQQALFR